MNRLSAVLLSSTLLAGAAGCRNENAAAAPADPPPPAVTFVALTPEQVAVTGEWIATLDGNVNAQIRPQVSGYLVQARRIGKARSSGRARCCSRSIGGPFEAALAQARAQLAESAGAARQGRARSRARQAAGRTARDRPESAGQRRAARTTRRRPRVASAKAAVETAQLNLGFTRVTSLIDGVAAIATRADRRSRRADDAPDDGLAGRSDQGVLPAQRAGVSRHRRPGRDTPASTARAVAGERRARRWSSPTAAPTRNAAPSSPSIARSIRRWARSASARTFPNPGNVLRPGQYGRVRAQTAVRQDALLVPQRAVAELQSGYQLRVLTPDNTVSDPHGRRSASASATAGSSRTGCRPATASSSTPRRSRTARS